MSMTVPAGSTPVSMLVGAPVAAVEPDASLHEAADVLTNQGIGAVLVGGRDEAVGIVSERDIVLALANRLDPATTRATDIAHTTLVCCDAAATVSEVAARMMDRYVRHVLLTDEGRVVGIVSARDVLGVYATADIDDDSGEQFAELWTVSVSRKEGPHHEGT